MVGLIAEGGGDLSVVVVLESTVDSVTIGSTSCAIAAHDKIDPNKIG
jgi:hypothetical protein